MMVRFVRMVMGAVWCLLFVFGILTASAQAEATKILAITQDDLTDGAVTTLDLRFDVADRLTMTRTDDSYYLVMAVVTYNEDSGCVPELEVDNDDGALTAYFAARGSCAADAEIEQEWEIAVGDFETDTDIAIRGAGLAGKIDLGGLPLRNVELKVPHSDMNVDFSSSTKRSVEKILVHNTGGKVFKMKNIGNTDFGTFELFSGGVKNVLDFRGEYKAKEHVVNIEGAAGRFNIVVPADAGQIVQSFSRGTRIKVGPLPDWNKKKRINNAVAYSSRYEYEHDINLNLTTVYSKIGIIRKQ
ncbi:MAG: hypothetical protein GY850_44460 [bacterium]|nr:hypothetical protein [bacterium]